MGIKRAIFLGLIVYVLMTTDMRITIEKIER